MSESLRQKVSGAMFWNTVLFPLKVVISLLASLIVVNGLKVTGFGIYGSMLAAATLVNQFTDLGLQRSLPKFLPEIEARFGRTGVRLFIQWILGVKLSLLILVVVALQLWTPFFVSLLNLPGSGTFLVNALSVVIILGSLADVMVQFLITFFKQKVTNLLDILGALVQPSLTALLVLLGHGVEGAVIAWLVSTVLVLGVGFWQARRAGRELAPSQQRVHLRDLLTLGPRFWPYALLIYLINISSRVYEKEFALVVLSALKDESGVGILNLGVNYVREFIQFLVRPLFGIQTPLFARLFVRNDKPALQAAYGSFMRLLMLALTPAGIGLILFSRGLIQLLYLEEFGAAAPVAVILITGSFLDSMLGSVPHNILMSFERYKPVIVSRLLILGTVPLLFWLAPRYSALGAAVAMTVARLSGAVVVLGYVSWVLQLRYPWRFLGRVLGASAALAVVLLPVLWVGQLGLFDATLPENVGERIQGVLILLGLALVGAVVFVLVFKLLGGLEERDRTYLSDLRFPLKKWILRWM